VGFVPEQRDRFERHLRQAKLMRFDGASSPFPFSRLSPAIGQCDFGVASETLAGQLFTRRWLSLRWAKGGRLQQVPTFSLRKGRSALGTAGRILSAR
jgi:hypothetical protein